MPQVQDPRIMQAAATVVAIYNGHYDLPVTQQEFVQLLTKFYPANASHVRPPNHWALFRYVHVMVGRVQDPSMHQDDLLDSAAAIWRTMTDRQRQPWKDSSLAFRGIAQTLSYPPLWWNLRLSARTAA
ncbi:hypothetical protein F5Y16DRAFT_405386 [Xylariaceae sp. FL0255]|nr:hypothetical protein F5Y16DRAFT_405386 [Xylariaceae sp. FL0255]